MTTYIDEQTVMEQEAFEHYKKIEAENFHLKKQLQNKNKDIKRLKHVIRTYKIREEKANQHRKPEYKNNRRGKR